MGDFGYSCVLIAFVSACVACVACWQALLVSSREKQGWWCYAKYAFLLHSLALFFAIAALYFLIFYDQFSYYYVYAHTMRALPWYYKLSCLWEGQEGSFLLWLFWGALLGLYFAFVRVSKASVVLFVLAIIQVFLSAMLLGINFSAFSVGSSPFVLTSEAIDMFRFSVPLDGKGLNPLLQNYWMVIHPPVLFAGFALFAPPLAYALAALWEGPKYKRWVMDALPWVLGALLVLGIGILMGAYWAYETLNFGGYWNWDPVENAVYVPWLVMIAALHAMQVYRRKRKSQRLALGLICLAYVLVLYATFLIRSGILGDASVHAFTDAGLSTQLIIFMTFIATLCVVAFVRSPLSQTKPLFKGVYLWYRADFWLLIGIATLLLMAYQVLIPTSFPVFNAIANSLGLTLNLAPPADAPSFYARYQIPLSVVLLFASGVAQSLTQKRLRHKKEFLNILRLPLILTMILASLLFLFSRWQVPIWMLLATACLYALVANLLSCIRLIKKRWMMSPSAVAHTGIAVLVLGILASSGFSKIISENKTGLVWSKSFPDEVNDNDILLFRHQIRPMQDYQLLYEGNYYKLNNGKYVPKEHFLQTENPYYIKPIHKTKKTSKPLLLANAGKIYFKIRYQETNKNPIYLYPSAQDAETMGIIYEPHIVHKLNKDI